MSELFRSENVVVRSVPTEDQTRWVVTFDNYGSGPGFDRPGFGEIFLQKYGVSAVHVLGRGNDWYQYGDMWDALASVRRAVEGAERVITYGSSMGGYAAVRFAEAAGAHSGLALSPQYSLDPAKAPDETRWRQEARCIRWLPDVDGPIQRSVRPVIVYDPVGPDGWHGRRIAAEADVVSIRLPHTAHPVAVYLDEIGLLGQMVFDTLSGTLNAPEVEAEARRRRRQSANYHGELSIRQPPVRAETALWLARKASALHPGNGHALTSLARALHNRGLYDEAIEVHLQLAAASGRKHDYMVPFADTLTAAGRLQDASDIAEEVVGSIPDLARLQAWAARAHLRAGRVPLARSAAEAAVALDPSEEDYHRLADEVRLAETPLPAQSQRLALRLWRRARKLLRRVRGLA